MTRDLIDQQFHFPRTPIGLAAVSDPVEPFLIRAILESLGAAVMTHFIGTPKDLLTVVGQGSTAPPYLVISSHGDDNGLFVGEFAKEIDTSVLKEGSLPASSLKGAVRLPGTIVFSTACESGRPEFAEAFLSGGARAYIASADLPDGSDVPLIVHMLFHQLLHRGRNLEAAWQHTVDHVEEARGFTLFSDSGRSAATA